MLRWGPPLLKSASDILSLAVCELRNRHDFATPKPSAKPRAKPCAKLVDRKNTEKAPKTTPLAVKTATGELSRTTKYIPAALRRAVAKRDSYRCSYVGPENSEARRCDAVHRLEFDHVTPRAFGGQNTLGNLRLLCRAHNNLAAKDVMGKEFIEAHFGRG